MSARARAQQHPRRETGVAPTATTGLPADDAILRRLEEAEETLRAIRTGEVDAVVVNGPDGPRTYTLVTADESYRMLVEQMRDGALTLSNDGIVLYSNGRLSPALGSPEGHIVGKPFAELVLPEDAALLDDLLDRGRQEQAGGELRLRKADGSDLPVHLSLSPLRAGGFRGLCAVATDLSERKRREKAAADERLTEAILEYAGTGILLCDGDGVILRANARAAELCPDPLGRRFDDLFTPADCFRLLVDTYTEDAGIRHDVTLPGQDGRPLSLLASARPLRDGDNGACWIVTLTDITRRKQLEAERARLLEAERTARENAEIANNAKTRFLAVMSHELRTPLTAVIGYADLLREGVGGPLDPVHRGYVDRIKNSAWHLLGLIEEILTYARAEAGHDAAQLRPVDLATIAREAVALVETQARNKGLELRVTLPQTPAIADCDAGKLRQIVLNLLGNAVKFTDRGMVDFALEPFSDGFRFRVRDTGPGIEPADLERIFEPFTQIDQTNTRSAGGTGLGLTIVRQLARLLGGYVQVESTPGQGSSFTLVLPGRTGSGDATEEPGEGNQAP